MRGGAAVVARERVAAVTPPLISPLRGQLQSTRQEPPTAVALRHAPAGAAPQGKPFCCRGRRPRRPAEGSRPLPTMQLEKGRLSGRVVVFVRPARGAQIKKPHRPEQRTMGRNAISRPQKAQSKTPKRRRSLLLAGAAPERQNSRQARGWLWLVVANHAYTLPYSSCNVKRFPKNNSHYFCRI